MGSAGQIVYDGSGNKFAYMNGQLVQEYIVPLTAGVQAVYNPSGLQYYRHADWLGSSRLQLDPSGNLVGGRAYAPFGETFAETGTDRSFTGHTQDVIPGSTGIYDFLFRQQASSQGRWLVPDPAGLAAVDITNPQTWNRYAYVANNPLRNVDPLGLYCGYLNQWGTAVETNGIDDNSSVGECGATGGYWIEGSYGGGSSVQVNAEQGTVIGLGYNSNGNAEYSIAGALGSNPWGSYTQTFGQITLITVGEFDNGGTPWHHAAISIGNGQFYGQNPKNDAQFLRHFAVAGPDSPGVPGEVKVQDPVSGLDAVTLQVSGLQAAQMQAYMDLSLQNAPPYDVYGPPPSVDCAAWIQHVFSAAGINTGPPTQYPSQLLQQLRQVWP